MNLYLKRDALLALVPEKHWDQKALAEIVNIHPSQINRPLSGQRQPGPKLLAGPMAAGIPIPIERVVGVACVEPRICGT